MKTTQPQQEQKKPMKSRILCVATALRQPLLLGWVITLGLSARASATRPAEEVFEYDQTRPVLGMPEVRAARPAGAERYLPAVYQANARGWVIVAESFAAYQNAREAAIAKDRPLLVEPSKSEI